MQQHTLYLVLSAKQHDMPGGRHGSDHLQTDAITERDGLSAHCCSRQVWESSEGYKPAGLSYVASALYVSTGCSVASAPYRPTSPGDRKRRHVYSCMDWPQMATTQLPQDR